MVERELETEPLLKGELESPNSFPVEQCGRPKLVADSVSFALLV